MQATQVESLALRSTSVAWGRAAGRQQTSAISPFRYWRFCAAMGPVFLAVFIVCWGVLGYNIREHHFSTEKDVANAAGAAMEKVRIKQLKSTLGAVYEVGHFVKRQAPEAVA